MDNKDKKPAEQGYGGVVYTPGSAARAQDKPYKTSVTKKPASVATRKVGVKRKKKKQKSQFGIFLAATMFTGVIVCIIVFAMVANSIMSQTVKPSTNSPVASANTPDIINEPIVPISFDKSDSITGIIKSIGTDGMLSVYDFNTGKNLNLIADNLSSLKNKYGEPIVFAEISIGDIVDVEYAGNAIKELFFSRQATEYKNISNIKIYTVEQTIEIGNESYGYNDQLITYDKSGNLDLTAIKPMDVVSVKFYKNIIWYLELIKGHGYIDFTGTEQLKDGVVEINNNIIRSLDDFEKLEILEGSHRVVVKASNINPFVEEVYIDRNASATLDLSDVEFLSGQLVINVNESDYTVKIDGEEVDLTQPINLEYGEYAVTVEKEGFFPWEGSVNISERTNQLTVELSEKILFCKFSIDSIPVGAEIYIDNYFIGITPCTANIEYGTHTLTYKKEGYKSFPCEVTMNEPFLPYVLYLQEETPFMPY